MCKVSIVMPSRNVAAYIGKCLDSLVNQTLQDIEIICVDAQSTDGTRDIIRRYQEKDSRITLFDDTEGSSGYADNLGFSKARGEYVSIVETDDYIRDDMMECLYAIAKKEDLDYVKADFAMFIEVDGKDLLFDHVQPLSQLKVMNRVINPSDYPELLDIDGYMWKGIYKKEFIEKYNIKLNETKGAAYQDNGFLHQTICQAQRVMYVSDSFYRYRRDNDNSSDYNPRGLEMMLEEYKFIDIFMKKHQDQVNKFKYYYYYKLYQQFRAQFEKTVRFGVYDDKVKEVVSLYKQYLYDGVEQRFIRPSEFGEFIHEVYMFLKDEMLFFQYMKRLGEARDRAYSDFLQYVAARKEIVIVCSGYRGSLLHCWLRRNNCNNIVAICDNNKKVCHTMFFDKEILPVEEACKLYGQAYFLIANDAHYIQLRDQLVGMGIPVDHMERFNLAMGPHTCTSQIVNSNFIVNKQ